MNRLGFLSLLLLSAWCGLVAGLLEVGTIVLRKHTVDPNRLYGLSRHFLWLIPVTYFCVFLALGLFGCIVCLASPRRGQRTRGASVVCSDIPAGPLRRRSPGLQSGLGGRGDGGHGAGRSDPPAACTRFSPVRRAQLPGGPRDGADPRGLTLGGGLVEAVAPVGDRSRRRGRPMSS